jgi:hypothetical protein
MSLYDIVKFLFAVLGAAYLAGAAVTAQGGAIASNTESIAAANRRIDNLEPKLESINDVREDVAYMKGRVDSIADRLGVPKDPQ